LLPCSWKVEYKVLGPSVSLLNISILVHLSETRFKARFIGSKCGDFVNNMGFLKTIGDPEKKTFSLDLTEPQTECKTSV
jgi:hypothetical protein